MARLIGIVREEVKQLIATLIFISIWHNDTEYHEVVRESLLFLSNSTSWDARKHCPRVVTARHASMGGSGSCERPCRKLSPRSATPKFLFLRKTCSARSFSGSDSQPQCFSRGLDPIYLFWLTHLLLFYNSQISSSRWAETGEVSWCHQMRGKIQKYFQYN